MTKYTCTESTRCQKRITNTVFLSLTCKKIKQVLDVEEFEKKIIEQNPDLEGFSCLQMVDEIQNFSFVYKISDFSTVCMNLVGILNIHPWFTCKQYFNRYVQHFLEKIYTSFVYLYNNVV